MVCCHVVVYQHSACSGTIGSRPRLQNLDPQLSTSEWPLTECHLHYMFAVWWSHSSSLFYFLNLDCVQSWYQQISTTKWVTTNTQHVYITVFLYIRLKDSSCNCHKMIWISYIYNSTAFVCVCMWIWVNITKRCNEVTWKWEIVSFSQQ